MSGRHTVAMTRGRRVSDSVKAFSERQSLPMAVLMQDLINDLEIDAYLGVLQAFAAQSEDISWAKEGLLSELRRELRIPDETHRELVTKISRKETWESIRESRKIAQQPPTSLSEAQIVSNAVPMRKRKDSHMNICLPPSFPSMLSKSVPSLVIPLQAGDSGRRHPFNKVTSVQPRVMSWRTGAASGISERSHRGRGSVSNIIERNHFIGRPIHVRSWGDDIFYDAVVKDYD